MAATHLGAGKHQSGVYDGARQVKRSAEDADGLVLEQLIVGVLLFTPLLLLLPTTLVFFSFASILHWGYLCGQLAFTAAAAVLRANPTYSVIRWLLKPAAYPSGIWFKALPPPAPCENNACVCGKVLTMPEPQYLRLQSIPCDLALILAPCWAEIGSAVGTTSVFRRLTSLLQDWSTATI